ncbi:MAG TPA: PC4/YdbC family ssDNA-binding protein [Atribacterota bacterium]|nr:PC4/YdbC family ssDNA-binding protein [Atribacterota bacterium]
MKEIGKLDITDNKQLVLSVGEFRGRQRVDLRTYVKPKDQDEYILTKKGINFDAEWIDDFVELVEKLKDVDLEK